MDAGSWSLSDVWHYIVGDEEGQLSAEAWPRDAALRAALAAPGGQGEALRRLQGLVASGEDPLRHLEPRELERLRRFEARHGEFVQMVRPDFTVGGWTTCCNDEADVVFAYRSAGERELQVLSIKDIRGFDAVQAAAGFSEVDLHACHAEGLLESAPLVESADAGLWVQLRETTDELVQVEMVNLLAEPLGAIMHMYYSMPESGSLFPDVAIPEPRKPRQSLNYKQCVTFSPLPQGHVRIHFGFILDMAPRMQLAIQRLPAAQVSILLGQAWPTTFQTFMEKQRAEITARERTSVHAPFYQACRECLRRGGFGQQPGGSVPRMQAEEEAEEAFFDAEDGEQGEGPLPQAPAGAAVAPPRAEAEAPGVPGPLQAAPELGPLVGLGGPAAGPSEPGPAGLPDRDQQALWERFLAGWRVSDTPSATRRRRPSSVGAAFNEYQARHAADYEALRLLEPLDGWDFRMTCDGVDIYTKDVEDMPCKCFKGYVKIRTFGHGRRSLGMALKELGRRTEWDDLCLESRVVEAYPPFYSVGYFKFASPTRLISTRDMLVLSHIFFEEDGSVLYATRSTVMEEFPEELDCVRATLHNGGYIVRPTEDSEVFTLIYAGCVSGGGWVPEWVQDLVAWRQPLALGKFKVYFEESAREGGPHFEALCGGGLRG
mmetsp:Transcript_34181/g.108647  ORF Transcript_34181/g.108647 Transcript_34181/m.108647 type:complete len:658 (-) Transcript_34181:143-2116(-)